MESQPGSRPSNQFSCGLINEREWFTRLGVPDLEFGWAAIDLPSYYDGFGSANGVGMPLLMFRTLQGQLQASSNTTGIDTVASISGNRVTSVTLNDNTSTQSVTIDLHAPSGATFTEVHARVLWLNSVTDEIQYATFQPIVTQAPDGLVVNISLPSEATCTLDCYLDGTGHPSRTNTENRYIGNKVVQWVYKAPTQCSM